MFALGLSPLKGMAQLQLFRKFDLVQPERRKADKIDFLYKVSNVSLLAGTGLDVSTTVRALHHPRIAYRPDGTVVGYYNGAETGWAGIFGKRNAAAVSAANVGLNTGIAWLSQKLYRRGGRWRIAATVLNFVKAENNMQCGIENIGYLQGVDSRLRQQTGYRGQILWRH